MTDKERLRDVKENSMFGVGYRTVTKENFEWLIRQAERAQWLEGDVQGLRDRNLALSSKLDNHLDFSFKLEGQLIGLTERNKRYREALEVAYLRLSNDYCLKETRNDILKVLEELK